MTASRRRPVALCAAAFWTGATGTGLCDGLRQKGWLVQEVDIRAYEGLPGKTLATRLLRRVQKAVSMDAYRARILEDCKLLKPDLFLTVKGVEITAELLAEIAAMGITTCNYYPDVDFNHRGVDEEAILAYDHMVTTKTFQLDWLRQNRPGKGNYYVPHGYSQLVHQSLIRGMTESDYTLDVGYAGNHSAHKAAQLGELLDRVADVNLGVTGPNWHNLDGWPKLQATLDGVERRNVAFSDFIQRSRVNLSFHYGQGAHGWADLVSTRSFEIPACGGFMLHVENDEIREFYDVGSEIDTFASVEEMADKIAYYLPRSDVRARMVAKALERTVPTYSYAARAAEMLAAIGMEQLGTAD